MKQTIEIEVPEGKRAVWKEDKIVFEDIKPQLPKTWEEFCEKYPINENKECFIDDCSNINNVLYSNDGININRKRIIKRDKNLLPSEETAEQHLALMQLHQLRDCYRQGWKPNWNNDLENKHCIVYTNRVLRICVYRTTRRFLTFQSYEIAEKFLNNFRDLITLAGDLI